MVAGYAWARDRVDTVDGGSRVIADHWLGDCGPDPDGCGKGGERQWQWQCLCPGAVSLAEESYSLQTLLIAAARSGTDLPASHLQ